MSSSPERTPVIIAARRTPIGRAGGALSAVTLEALAAPVITALLADTAIPPNAIDDVILGNAAGGGGNIARLAALEADLPLATPGMTVDRQCGSGLAAIVTACQLIAGGAGEVFLAGGVESVSRAPLRAHRPQNEGDALSFYTRARFAPDKVGDPEMGVAAENVARAFGITRARQDAFALESHAKAVAAQASGAFDAEIVPLADVTQDECPRASTSLEKLASLKPKFAEDGTVTAGNACPLNDGASVVLVTSLARARAMKAPFALLFEDAATAGVDPNILGIGPVASTKALNKRRPDLAPEPADFIEFNEAFAAQVLASLDQLAIAPERVNRNGGALALGHPFGASGAILVTRLFHQMKAHPGTLGLAMIGIGGGMGITAAFRAIKP
ncbi:MAG: thiolase family protein [Proteobacteria bacterium]|nr:thiolase family protein [Pseudomonadota bacterium]